MFLFTLGLLGMVGLATRVGWVVGLVALILAALIYAVAIALFTICMAL